MTVSGPVYFSTLVGFFDAELRAFRYQSPSVSKDNNAKSLHGNNKRTARKTTRDFKYLVRGSRIEFRIERAGWRGMTGRRTHGRPFLWRCGHVYWPPMVMRIAFVADFQRCRHHAGMIALTDHQLATVMDAAATIAPERRDIFLKRVGAMLKVRGRFSDADVGDVARLALAGLVQTAHVG